MSPSSRPPRRRPHPAWGIVGALLAIVVAAACLALVWPQALGLQRELPFTQLVSFRLVGAIGLAGALLVVAFALLVSRRLRALLAASATVLLVATLAAAGIVLVRGTTAAVPATGAPEAVRVLAWNTLGNEPGSPTIAQLALDYDADVLMLPETTLDMGLEIAGLLGEQGRPMWVLSSTPAPGYRAAETTLLVSAELGEYEVVDDYGDTSVLASVVADPVDGTGPRLIAAHPVAPVPEHMANWRADLEWLAGLCTGDAIVAGDFNATLDHLAGLEAPGADGAVLGECRDAALDAGAASLGTWTSGKPPLLVPAIDHVMHAGDWEVTGFEVITREDRSGSDHRPVFAELRRPTG